MNFIVEVPQGLPDAIQCTPSEFTHEAKMAMAAKLYEMRRLSSGMAATLAGVSRIQFLLELNHYGVAMINLEQEELESDVINA